MPKRPRFPNGIPRAEVPSNSHGLRDRIAAALKAQAEFRGIYKIADFDFQFLADAVIEALNLDVAVTYLSVDKLRREFCVEGHYTVEVNDA